MRKKKEPLPKPVYPPIPDDFVFPTDLDKIEPEPIGLFAVDKKEEAPD